MIKAKIIRNDSGAAAVEMAFVLPILVLMIWIFAQLATMYRALSGIQMALGQGARFATICTPKVAGGCDIPTADQVKAQVEASVYGLGPGTFTVSPPAQGSVGQAQFFDLKVTYTQATSLLFVPGPDITMVRSKRVWTANTTA